MPTTKKTENDTEIEYLTLSKAARVAILRDNLTLREAEHFRLVNAYGTVESAPDERFTLVTNEVRRLQAELKALETE